MRSNVGLIMNFYFLQILLFKLVLAFLMHWSVAIPNRVMSPKMKDLSLVHTTLWICCNLQQTVVLWLIRIFSIICNTTLPSVTVAVTCNLCERGFMLLIYLYSSWQMGTHQHSPCFEIWQSLNQPFSPANARFYSIGPWSRPQSRRSTALQRRREK